MYYVDIVFPCMLFMHAGSKILLFERKSRTGEQQKENK